MFFLEIVIVDLVQVIAHCFVFVAPFDLRDKE